jgi:hypothetical protein
MGGPMTSMGLFRRWLSRSRFGWFGALVVRSIWADPGRSLARIPVCGFSIASSNSVGPGSEMNTASVSRAAAKALSALTAPYARGAAGASGRRS